MNTTNTFMSSLVENISNKLFENDSLLEKIASNFNLDKFSIVDKVCESITDDIDVDDIKDSIQESLVSDIDTDDIEERAVDNIVDNTDMDDVYDRVSSKIFKHSLDKSELMEHCVKYLMENSAEFRGSIIDNVSNMIFNHIMNDDPVLLKQKEERKVSVENINKALVSGNLEVGTSGLPVGETVVVDISSRGI